MKDYAILRINKLPSIQKILDAAKHNNRSIKVKNVDPSLSKLNQTFFHTQNVSNHIENAIKNRNLKVRNKNTVLCTEYLLTSSPQWFENLDEETINEWTQESLKWLETKHGSENVVAAWLHRNETTPHLHVFILPIKDNAFNAKAFFGNKKLLSSIQSEYHNAISKKFPSLSRGEKGSFNKHVPMQEIYKKLENEENQKVIDAKVFAEKNFEIITNNTSSLLQKFSLQSEINRSDISQACIKLRERDVTPCVYEKVLKEGRIIFKSDERCFFLSSSSIEEHNFSSNFSYIFKKKYANYEGFSTSNCSEPDIENVAICQSGIGVLQFVSNTKNAIGYSNPEPFSYSWLRSLFMKLSRKKNKKRKLTFHIENKKSEDSKLLIEHIEGFSHTWVESSKSLLSESEDLIKQRTPNLIDVAPINFNDFAP